MTETEYPQNLLDAIDGGRWEYPLPADFSESLEYVLAGLTPRERGIVYAHFRDGRTFRDIGQDYNVTGERIKQLLFKSISKLKHPTRSAFLIYGVRGMIDKARQNATNEQISEGIQLLSCIAKRLSEIMGEPVFTEKADAYVKESLLNKPLNELGLSVRGYNILARAGVKNLRDITRLTLEKIYSMRNMGRKTYDEILAVLSNNGLSFDSDA